MTSVSQTESVQTLFYFCVYDNLCFRQTEDEVPTTDEVPTKNGVAWRFPIQSVMEFEDDDTTLSTISDEDGTNTIQLQVDSIISGLYEQCNCAF